MSEMTVKEAIEIVRDLQYEMTPEECADRETRRNLEALELVADAAEAAMAAVGQLSWLK